MIGQSDVAYTLCLLKNSMNVWTYDPTDTSTMQPKQLSMRGESKKRKFVKTTMSMEEMKFVNEGVKNWSKEFNRSGALYGSLKAGWETWLDQEASVVDTDGWRRKTIHNLLATKDHEFPGVGENIPDKDGTDTECEISYDSNGDIKGPAFIAPAGRGGRG